jgi:ParB family transcriptional regulator, chromosome partitioning protein
VPPPQELQDLPVDLIDPNLSQPRRYFDEATLQALAGSLRDRGVLQPVLVRTREDGRYELIVGERRWRAAKIAALASIPALVCPFDDGAVLEAALIENMAREDLNPVEEARACATLIKDFGLSHRQIGARVGRHMSVVSNLVRLLNLPAEILELVELGELSRSHALALLMAKDPQVRPQLARAAIEEGWSISKIEARARESNRTDSAPNSPGSVPTVTMSVASVWGDLLGVEVNVRTLRTQKLRLEVVFDSPEAALALGGRLGKTVARGSKRR